ncbi:MAG: PD40 domain-containing protein [Cytophagia bacterium]|nr:PD40 domain-containing protein [Cytophagia bacterium]
MRFLFIISFLFIALAVQCQEQLHTKRAKLIDAYGEAKELVRIGNLYQSIEILTGILDKDDSFDEAVMLIHEVYIKRDEPNRASAIISQYASELEPAFLNRLLLIQANYKYQFGEYEEAQKLLSNVNGEVYDISADRVEFLKQSIQFSLEQLNELADIEFEKLPNPINEFDMQYFPSITAKSRIVFTVRDRLARGNEDLYTAYIYKEGIWSEPVSISGQINTERNEGTASISADGKTLVFTICNKPGNIGSCDLYISYFKNNDWTNPELLGPEVNSEAWDSQPSLSARGETLYFVSEREGGFGKQDIWMSRKMGEGWSPAVNLGESINTPEDDCSPFIYLDGKTLIYSTRGRVGLGGYDLFKSVQDANDWSAPENLGYPINNAFDQVGYCISADRWAYFSSSEAGGRIFLQRFRVPDSLVPEVDLGDLIDAYGKVVDASTGELLAAKVYLIHEGDTVERDVEDDGQVLLGDDEFSFAIAKRKGYRSSQLSRTDFLKDSTLRLTPFKAGEDLLEKPIPFQFDSDVLLEEAFPELNRVAQLLLDHPELEVEIRGYTDASGKESYNLGLSERRAKAVYQYIVEKLHNSDNLSFKGYGESHPIDTRIGGLNRRVEIITRTVVR